ncbi:HD domain-containing phosphohydrolase, partial [Mycobacterium kubicae]|uniref:HD domain-containing phosphohydrolase n=1 Tax=Mycobacterium kubicae TaxID=120959 RepID=UPI000A4EE0B2
MASIALSRSADRPHNRVVPAAAEAPELPTHAELLAALSVAIDLGLGQPAEHMLRAALIATRLADRLGLTKQQRDCVYYTTLIIWIGCHADSHEYARWFGDDIAVRHDSYLVDWAGLPYWRFLIGNVGRGQPLLNRLSIMTALFVDARGQLSRMIHSHCTSAALLADRMGLGPDVQAALGFAFERYDGGGLPSGARAEDIPIQMRVAQLAELAEVHHRTYGSAGAMAMVRSRRGGQFDPVVADAFL